MKTQLKIIISLFILFIALVVIIAFFVDRHKLERIEDNHEKFGDVYFKGVLKDIAILNNKGSCMFRLELISTNTHNYDTRIDMKGYVFIIKENKAEIITYCSGEKVNDTIIFNNNKFYIKRKDKVLNSYFPIMNSNSFPNKKLEKIHKL